MADLQSGLKIPVEILRPSTPYTMPGVLFEGDENANRITLVLMKNGEPADIGTVSVSGEVERADGNRVPCEGEQNGNELSIILNANCYNVPGACNIFVIAKSEGVERTLAEINAHVRGRSNGAIVEVENVIPSIADILQRIDELEAAGIATVEAIEAKGQEVRESLPDDYTALAGEVSQLNATQSQQAFDGANFAFDKIGTITGGFVTLRADTGNKSHQNYLYCRSDRRKVSRFFFKAFTGGVYTHIRPFIQDSAGHIYTFVILPATGRCQVYDESFAGVVGSVSQISTGTILEGTHTVDVVIVGTTVCIYIDGVYSYRIDLSALMSGDITRVGYNFRGYSNVNSMSAYKDGVVYHRERFAHISFDDQLECLRDLVVNSRASVWDGTYFSVLKNFHDMYGCKFTLELYYQNEAENPTFDLSMVPTTYKSEFISASGWLKFAYHGPDPTTKPADDMTAAELTQSVSDVYAQIKRFAGQCCIDTTPRLSYFNATKEQVLGLKSAGYITGLLTADDTREANSGLTAAELGIIQTHDVYTDYVNKITYFRSGTRFDSATAEIAVATLIADESSRQNNEIYIIFAHNYTEQDMQDKLSAIAAWCNGRGIMYDYPFNHLEYDS